MAMTRADVEVTKTGQRSQPGRNDAEALRGGIEKTRADMSANVAALEQRLGRGELTEKVTEKLKEQLQEAKAMLKTELGEVKETVKADLAAAKQSAKQDMKAALVDTKQSIRDATLGRVEDAATRAGDMMNDTRDTLVDTIRQNPLPAALAGIGAAWLLMNRSRSARGRGAPRGYLYRSGDRLDFEGARTGGAAGDGDSTLRRAGDLARGAKESAGRAAERISSAASQVKDEASAGVGTIAEQAGDAASRISGRAQEVVGRGVEEARTQARRVEEGVEGAYERAPFGVGAAALAIGTAIGLALPRTRPEDELMGGARDDVLRRAGEATRQATQQVQHATEKATEKAQAAGGSVQRVAEKVQDVAAAAVDQATK